MKKIIAAAIMAVVLSAGQAAMAGTLDAIATAAGHAVAASMGKTNAVVNVTTITESGKVSGKNVDVGVVEMKSGNKNAVVNVTTVGGTITAKEKARVGVVKMD